MFKALLVFSALMTVLTASAASQASKPSAPPFLPLSVPYTGSDPVLDGLATSASEWAIAARIADVYSFRKASRSGSWFAEAKLDWEAESVLNPGNVEIYAGTTIFLAHDLVGSSDPTNALHQFQVQADSDWGSFRMPVPAGMAQIWIFADGNAVDDAGWLPFARGLLATDSAVLGSPPDVVDDVGFIVRLNDDPSTDVHWVPGLDPEPGEAAWDWTAWHGVFGRAGFGQSVQDAGLDSDTEDAVDHEFYEIAIHHPGLVVDPDAEGDTATWCGWWDDSAPEALVPRWLGGAASGTPVKPFSAAQALKKPVPMLRGDFWLHVRDPTIPEANPGNPTGEDDRDTIVAQLEALKFTAPFAASIALSRVQTFFYKAYADLVDGETKPGFANLAIAFKNVKVAGKQGVSPAGLLEPLTGIATLLLDLATQRVSAVDAAGLGVDSKALRKAYTAIYKVGRRLGVESARGEDAKMMPVARKTRRVFKAAQKAEKILAKQGE